MTLDLIGFSNAKRFLKETGLSIDEALTKNLKEIQENESKKKR